VLVLHHHQQQYEKYQNFKHLVIIFCCAALLACPQLLSFVQLLLGPILRLLFGDNQVEVELNAFFLDVNKNPIVLPICLMAYWCWHAWNKWEKYSLIVLYCLSAVVFIEYYSHVPSQQFSSSFQHVLRGLQKNFLSVILLQLWMHISVYLVLISHRGIGRQFYYIQKTLSNVVVVTYFLFIFIM
jgi:hypothetical protein